MALDRENNDSLRNELSRLLAIMRDNSIRAEESHTKGVQKLLIGGGAGLLMMLFLLEQHQARWGCWPQVSKGEALADDLLAAISDDGNLQWHASENLSNWSAGYFLNKTELNLAAALDRLINAWLVQRFHQLVDPLSPTVENILHTWPGARVTLLSAVVAEPATQRYLNAVCRSLAKDSSPPEVEAYLTSAGEHGSARTLSDIYNLLSGGSPEQCLAYVVTRQNAFKHMPIALTQRKEATKAVEWCVCLKALRCLVDMWNLMLEDIDTLKNENPRARSEGK